MSKLEITIENFLALPIEKKLDVLERITSDSARYYPLNESAPFAFKRFRKIYNSTVGIEARASLLEVFKIYLSSLESDISWMIEESTDFKNEDYYIIQLIVDSLSGPVVVKDYGLPADYKISLETAHGAYYLERDDEWLYRWKEE